MTTTERDDINDLHKPFNVDDKDESEDELLYLLADNNLFYATPPLILGLLERMGALLYLYKLTAYSPDNEDEGIPISSYDDLLSLPSDYYIQKEPITDADFKRLNDPDFVLFFRAMLGAITYHGNTRDGYIWQIKRPVMSLTEAISHFSQGWELHDIWGDIEALLKSDGKYIVLRNSLVLRDFDPPSTSLEAFYILYSKFGNAVFDRITWEDEEPYRYKANSPLITPIDIEHIMMETPSAEDYLFAYTPSLVDEKIKRRKPYMKFTKFSPSAIYSIERHTVIWGSTDIVYYYYKDMDLTISSFGIPMTTKTNLWNYTVNINILKPDYALEVVQDVKNKIPIPKSEHDYWVSLARLFQSQKPAEKRDINKKLKEKNKKFQPREEGEGEEEFEPFTELDLSEEDFYDL